MSAPARSAARLTVVLNPRAGAGRALLQLDALKRALDRQSSAWELKITEGPGHAAALARAAALAGAEVVAAAGGDGTCHEVVCGLLPGGARAEVLPALALIPFGTGSDLQRSLKTPDALDEAVALALRGPARPIDVGLAAVTRPGGPPMGHLEPFINVAGFGANGEVVRKANASSKRLGGAATFFGAALSTAFRYSPPRVRLHLRGPAGEGSWEGPLLSAFVANGAYCGGGMWVGKGGALDDGLLDLSVLPPDPALTQVLRSSMLYDGGLAKWPGLRRAAVQAVEAQPCDEAPVFVDLDGESPGQLPARFTLLPGALRARGLWLTGGEPS